MIAIAALLPALVAAGPAGPPAVVTVEAQAVSLGADERGTLEVVVGVRKGFRIQANPASRPFLVPAQLEVEPQEGLELGPAEYPPGEPYRLHGTVEDLSTYQGRFSVRLPVTARWGPDADAPELIVLAARLRYQACNESVCLRPAEVPVELRVRRGPGPARP